MKVTVTGCGHLGATHAACMASIGHEVVGVDIDEDKVSLLNSGKERTTRTIHTRPHVPPNGNQGEKE